MTHGHDHGNPEHLDAYIAKMWEASRAAWQKPDDVLAALALEPGDVVADIGAGPGYFSLRMERQQVFAVDVEPRILEALLRRVAAAGASHVTPVWALPEDPLLPEFACDVVLMVDTFHHFADGVAYLRRLRRALKPGGRLVDIDFHQRDLPVGPSTENKVSRDDFLAIAAAAGYTLATEHTFLPYQYFL